MTRYAWFLSVSLLTGCEQISRLGKSLWRGAVGNDVPQGAQGKLEVFHYTLKDGDRTLVSQAELLVTGTVWNDGDGDRPGISSFGVAFLVRNTDRTPKSFDWKNKYLKDTQGRVYAPRRGIESAELQPGFKTSSPMYAEYEIPSAIARDSGLRWGLYTDDAQDLAYEVMLAPVSFSSVASDCRSSYGVSYDPVDCFTSFLGVSCERFSGCPEPILRVPIPSTDALRSLVGQIRRDDLVARVPALERRIALFGKEATLLHVSHAQVSLESERYFVVAQSAPYGRGVEAQVVVWDLRDDILAIGTNNVHANDNGTESADRGWKDERSGIPEAIKAKAMRSVTLAH